MSTESRDSIIADLKSQGRWLALGAGMALCGGIGVLTGVLWAGAAIGTFGTVGIVAAVAMTAVGGMTGLLGAAVSVKSARSLLAGGTAARTVVSLALAGLALGSGLMGYEIAKGYESGRKTANSVDDGSLRIPMNAEMKKAIESGATSKQVLEAETFNYALGFSRAARKRLENELRAQYEDCVKNPETYRRQGLPCEKMGEPRP